MAEITNRTAPAYVPTTDALASIPADLLGPIPAEIHLGSNVLMVMEKPPEVKDVITVVMRLRIKDEGKKEAGEGNEELVHYRKAKVIAAWLKGEAEPPNADEDQPGLFDDDGETSGDEPESLGDVMASVARPDFSSQGE